MNVLHSQNRPEKHPGDGLSPRARRWVGRQGAGAREYTEDEARRVVALLREHCIGRTNAMSAEDFAAAYCGFLAPRAVRQIISDHDGIDYLLANEGDGLMFICEVADEGEATSRKLRARAESELRRVRRRDSYANEHLGRRQLGMGFDG